MTLPGETFAPDLPPQLTEAPREFAKWANGELLSEQRNSTPSAPLYHYTGEESLRGILQGQKLWCFSHLHQSDPTEFQYSLAIARRIIKEEARRSHAIVASNFCLCVDDMLAANGLAGPFDFYLFSLSRHRDHGPQWRAYGDLGHGFAIGFGPALLQPDKDDLYEEANRNIHVGRVIYGEDATGKRHRRAITRAAEITKRVGTANHLLLGRPKPMLEYLAAMSRELLSRLLIWECITAKDAGYADEQEVRGIILNTKKKFDPYRREHKGRSYVEHEMPLKAPGSIAEILVGPRAPPDATAAVKELLRVEGYPDTVPVRRSYVRV